MKVSNIQVFRHRLGALGKRVMDLREKGLSYRKIGREVKLSFASVRNIIKRNTAA